MKVCISFPIQGFQRSNNDNIPVIDYYDTIQDRPVVSKVIPGYLHKLLPNFPPEQGEKWEDIQKDIESKIMPGLTHWYAHLAAVSLIN